MNTFINKKRSFISLFLIAVIWCEALAMYIPSPSQLSMNLFNNSGLTSREETFYNSDRKPANQIKPLDQEKYYSESDNFGKKEDGVKPEEGGGPSTPEVQGFATASSDELVNLSTGDFNYNIPLMDVGGFPINIAYNSNITPHEDASWVGLGWALNPGSVNRNVRGLPDDFNGATIVKEAKMKPKEGFSVGAGLSLGFAGFDGALGASLGVGLDMDHNNYDGWGVKLASTLGLSANAKFGNSKMGGSLGLGLGIHSRSGGYMSPSVGLNGSFSTKHTYTNIGLNGNLTIDSREGFKEANFGVSSSMKLIRPDDNRNVDYQRNVGFTKTNFPLGFSSPSYSPTFEIPLHHHSQAYRLKGGGTING